MKRTILIVAGALMSFFGYAQDGYNPLSVRPVHTSDMMYQKSSNACLRSS